MACFIIVYLFDSCFLYLHFANSLIMKPPKRIGLFQTAPKQQPFAEYDRTSQSWRIWLAYNPDVSSGTYLLLLPTGAVDRVTVQDHCVINIVKVM